MDGVLVDNRDVHIEAFERLFAKYEVPFSREKFMPSFGMTNDQIFKHQAPQLIGKYDITALAAEKEETYRTLFEESIAPTAGLIAFLDDLKHNGVKIAVGSSGNTPNVNFVLTRCQIAPYFDAIANGDMISKGKPDPEVYLLAAKKLGVKSEECLVVEDAPVGIEAARRAGMAVLALATTFPREQLADYDLISDNFVGVDYASIAHLKGKSA